MNGPAIGNWSAKKNPTPPAPTRGNDENLLKPAPVRWLVRNGKPVSAAGARVLREKSK